MDPLTKVYLKVIEENANDGKVEGQSLKVGEPFGHSENKKNTSNFYSKSGPEAADGEVKDPEEAPSELSVDGVDNKPKEAKETEKLSKESKNPFDALFNKIISEDTFDFSTEAGNELTPDSDFGGPDGIGGGSDDEFGFGDDEEEEEDFESEEEEESIEELLSKIKELVTKLEDKIAGEESEEEGEEESEEEGEDEEESEEDEDETEGLNEEEVDAEILGHALVDQEKLEAGQTKKTVFTVKGAVPVSKKKATVVKGKKVNGKLEPHNVDPAVNSLTAKSNNVGSVHPGKPLFDQN